MSPSVTPSVEAYRATFDERVFEVLRPAAQAIPALAARLAEAGLVPDDLVDVAAVDRLPVLSKDDLIDLQAKDPPFGGYLAPGTRVRRIFQSPGPLYEPEAPGRDPWRAAPPWRRPGSAPATPSSTASATTSHRPGSCSRKGPDASVAGWSPPASATSTSPSGPPATWAPPPTSVSPAT